jgi:hypothetical protein
MPCLQTTTRRYIARVRAVEGTPEIPKQLCPPHANEFGYIKNPGDEGFGCKLQVHYGPDDGGIVANVGTGDFGVREAAAPSSDALRHKFSGRLGLCICSELVLSRASWLV